MGSSLHVSQGQKAHCTLHDFTPPPLPHPFETSLSPRHNCFSRPSTDSKSQKPCVPSPTEATCSGLYCHSTEASYFLGRGLCHGSQVTDGSTKATGQGDLPWTPLLQKTVSARAWRAVREGLPTSLLHLDHSSTILPDGPLSPALCYPHPSAIPSQAKEKQVTVLRPGAEALPEMPPSLPPLTPNPDK